LDKENFESLAMFDLGHYASAVFGDIKVSGDQAFFISARNKLYSFKFQLILKVTLKIQKNVQQKELINQRNQKYNKLHI
jgi:hypothetical protein